MTTVEPPRPPAPSSLPPSSRYASSEVASTHEHGEEVRFFRRRFLPGLAELSITHEHQVAPAERLDTIAAAELGDAALWWRVADANPTLRPAELTEVVGRRLRIASALALPEPPT